MKKIVNVIVVIVTIMFIGMNCVKAYEHGELLQKVALDKKLTINYRTPKSIDEANEFLAMFLLKNFKNISGQFFSCNEDYSECNLYLSDSENSYGENDFVKVIWNEEYSEIFKKIAPNNVATIKEMKPKNYKDFTTSYFDKIYPNIYGSLEECNEDLTVCDLIIRDSEETYYNFYEIHQVKINWQEEYSDTFKNIAPNNEVKMDALKPSNDAELEFYSTAFFARKYKDVFGYLSECNSDYTECILRIVDSNNEYNKNTNYRFTETHKVKVTWEKENKIAKKLVDAAFKTLKLGKKDKIINTSEDNTTEFIEYYHVVEDLNLINYLKNKEFIMGNDTSINFVPELKLLFQNTNISYNLDTRLGNAEFFYEMGGGQLSLLYKGVIYGLFSDNYQGYTSVYKNRVLYIPTNTAKTKEAYVAAAKKRLDEYLKEDVKVEVGGLIKEIDDGQVVTIPHFEATEEQLGDYYYKITINNETYNFLIVRDSSKMMVNNLIKSIDLDTNVKLETNASDVPNDAVLKVDEISKESPAYNKIKEIIKTDLLQAFDISLYSDTLGKNITKTEKGEFKITIPVMESLKGKNLIVYYIKDDNTLEEHSVTLDEEENATFTTNHFSTYILAEAPSTPIVSNNVQTGTINPLIVSIEILGLIIGMLYIGKSIKKEIN